MALLCEVQPLSAAHLNLLNNLAYDAAIYTVPVIKSGEENVLLSWQDCCKYELFLINQNNFMGFEQYHEPVGELSSEVRTFARMITSLTEEAEAISWYEQRIAVEKDKQARAIMENAQQEEFKHFGMDLEFLLRKKEKWRMVLQDILFKKGDIVDLGEKGEKELE
jgi:hypothetical protein